jgi:hypothetical protein
VNAPLRPAQPAVPRPIGYFVHHQGRGHAERAAALIAALPEARPVTVFCARPAVLPPLPPHVRVETIPSLFEPQGGEVPMDAVPQPETVHCAPLGWPGIREAMGRIADWMRRADPAAIVCDVSAEVAQLARLMSVPHVTVLQHGARGDPGHRAALDGAAWVLAPFHADLAQPDWDAPWRARAHFAPGLGLPGPLPPRAEARARLGLDPEAEVVLAVAGAGGHGLSAAPLSLGARAMPGATWIAIGRMEADWHATRPANLRAPGWVADPRDHFAAADLLVASTGNTTCHMALASGLPWVAVPEWRYFDEQGAKARALARAGLAHALPQAPASIPAWRDAVAAARAGHDPARQRAMIDPEAAPRAARRLEARLTDLWAPHPARPPLGVPA